MHRADLHVLLCHIRYVICFKIYFGMLRRWSALKMCKKPLVNRPSIKDLANLFLGSVPLNSVLSGVRVHMYLRFPPVPTSVTATPSLHSTNPSPAACLLWRLPLRRPFIPSWRHQPPQTPLEMKKQQKCHNCRRQASPPKQEEKHLLVSLVGNTRFHKPVKEK